MTFLVHERRSVAGRSRYLGALLRYVLGDASVLGSLEYFASSFGPRTTCPSGWRMSSALLVMDVQVGIVERFEEGSAVRERRPPELGYPFSALARLWVLAIR